METGSELIGLETRESSRPEPLSDSLATASGGGHILVVDDDPGIRRLLRRCLELAGYTVEECGSAREALDRIRGSVYDLVFLDLNLPDGSGHEILEVIRSDPATRLLPVVMLTGMGTTEERIRAYREGATDFLPKPFSPEELIPRVRSLVLLKQFADEHEHVEKVFLALAITIDARDAFTAGHSGRVADYADGIAARMKLDHTARLEIRRGALFHDLGKIVIPDSVLNKPGPLTLDERQIIERHPVAGYEVLSPMRTMRRILPIVYHHHERLDGSGYPDGISGAAITLPIRIVTVSDVFDALTSTRAYRDALTTAGAFEVLDGGVRSGWWDGEVVDELRGSLGSSRARITVPVPKFPPVQ
jgi:putative two-component system response regulator